MTTKSSLCIGGPLDGKYSDCDGVYFAVLPTQVFAYAAEPQTFSRTAWASDLIHYKKRTISTSDGCLSVWAIEDMSDLDVWGHLIRTYALSADAGPAAR